MNKGILFLGAVALWLFGACSGEEDSFNLKPTEEEQIQNNDNENNNENNDQIILKTRVDIPLSDRQKEIMKSKSTFDFNFFRSAYANADSEAKKLFVVSPYSASVFMAMLAEGADDDVRTEMIKALLGTEATIDELAGMMKLMSECLAKVDNTVKFKESNSVWYDNKVTLGKDFSNAVSQYFNAPSYQCDMYSIQAGKQINAWVKDATENLIESIIEDGYAPNTNTLWANVIYFRGQWTSPFEKKYTSKVLFHNNSGSETSVDMMSSDMSNLGYEGDGYKMVGLPYGNGAFTMYILLPDNSIDEFVKSLTPDYWKEMKEKLSVISLSLKLPRFTVNTDVNTLNKVLTTIGFKSNFAYDTTYDRICKELSGDQLMVCQSATLKVDETGSEGAAVTWGGWYGSDLDNHPETLYFTADRPFVFIIDEVSTGAILFAGVVNEM